MPPRFIFTLILSLVLLAACAPRERTGVAVSRDGEGAGGSGGAGGAGGAPADPCTAPICRHEIDLSTWCLSCLASDGTCADGDAYPRAACGESCDPFGGPGFTAIDVSCADGLWCSRCSGECAPLPRDCGC